MGVPPHVHGLLLAPHELGIGVAPQLPLHQVKGEGHQLQHSKALVRGIEKGVAGKKAECGGARRGGRV